jgi:pilus assembly protein CpaE
MLRGIAISPDQELSDQLEDLLTEVGHIGLVRKIEKYPAGIELSRFLRAHAPQVIFLSIENLAKAMDTISGIEATVPGMQIVAISRNCDPQTLLELMRIGVREFMSMPFSRQDLYETLGRINENLEKKPVANFATDMMFSFLPSKAGVGASTIALNASVSASQLPEAKTILVDFDLNSGMQRFMLKLDNEYCLTDAAENSFRMDDNLWPQLVTTIGNLDVLHSGKLNPNFRIEASQVRHLIDYMRRMYKVVCVDLSGNMEKYSLEIMQESKRVFLVCTPEITSLHLAREKYNYLKTLDLGDRVTVLLNRAQKRAVISPAQIEELLGIPVAMTFPNDYQGVHRALTIGRNVEPSTELGKQFSKLAQSMFEKKVVSTLESKKRFVEYFNLLPGRYSLFPDGKKPAL